MDKFLSGFGRDLRTLYERDFSNRLQDIEKEIESERARQELKEREKEKEVIKD